MMLVRWVPLFNRIQCVPVHVCCGVAQCEAEDSSLSSSSAVFRRDLQRFRRLDILPPGSPGKPNQDSSTHHIVLMTGAVNEHLQKLLNYSNNK